MQSLLKAAAAASLLWGGLAAVGGATGGDDILRPLSKFSVAGQSQGGKASLAFNQTTTLDQVQAQLQAAQRAGQPAMLDFYADWCLDCKRMHRTTFKSENVHAALAGWRLIEVDVTETSSISEAVKRHFNVFGPPATLFFNAEGSEVEALRQYGYLNENEFIGLVTQVK